MPTIKGAMGGDSDGSSCASDTANIDVEEEEGEEEVEDSEESEEEEDDGQPEVMWTGYGKKIPVIVFKADAVVNKNPENKYIGKKYHMAYKIVKTECKLVRSILGSHGFHEVHPNSNDFNMQWTGSHLKPYVLRSLQEFQKVNHFPRSYEITRKDRLYKNVQRMQQTKGFRHFDFVPSSYIIPGEFQDFCSAFLKDKGPWIVKPIASSRGRGIFLVNHPEQVPLDETMIVSRYLASPLTIDGFKFDVRLYVGVTSYDPLIIYLYEEGLTRFATVRYEKNNRSIRNQCMHLTNYSVNKKSNDYVKNDDADVEDYGNKWSLGAMLRYLRSMGKDTTALMMRVEDVIIKTLISAELPIATACKMFMPFRGNCFELYGFDILIDDNLRPWVLEVNLSPSLACDAPLDLKIKSNMLSDLFSLVGFVCHDPMLRKMEQSKRNREVLNRPPTRAQSQKGRPGSASSSRGGKTINGSTAVTVANAGNLSGEEIKIVRRAKEEHQRRGGWVRIFPSPDSWELYGSYLQYSSTHNVMLYQQLFPDRARTISLKPTTAGYSSSLSRTRSVTPLATRGSSRSVHLHSSQYPQLHVSAQAGADEALTQAIQRTLQYERKLSCLGQRKKPKPEKSTGSGAPNINGKFKGVLVQGIPEDASNSEPSKTKSNDNLSKCDSDNPDAENSKQSQQSTKKAIVSRPATGASERSQPQPMPDPPKSPEIPDSTKENPKEVKVKVTEPPAEPRAQPAKVQRDPDYNVVRLLEKGKTMSKVQARFAFATYLMRVQQRLMTESSNRETDDTDAANEQMDLVLRFLKRAAGNLQQPFKVVVPSRKLALNDRRRILAKQLGDFVHIYGKETEQLRQRSILEKKLMKRPPTFSQNDGLDEEKFNKFVNTASESELEEVLTTYTKLNKSASIFLGSNSKTTDSRGLGTMPNSSQSDTCLARRKEGGGDTIGPSNAEHVHPHFIRPASSSYASAVTIYSTRLGARARPMSANPKLSEASHHNRSRPVSAHTRPTSAVVKGSVPPTSMRERPDGAECTADQVDEENINAALHRLALRQQQRQYAANRNSIVLSGDNPQPHKPGQDVTKGVERYESSHQDDLTSQVEDETGSVKHKVTENNMWRPDKTANETFNNFVSDSDLVAAYNQVTGVNPLDATNYRPTSGSTQFQLIEKKRNLASVPLDQQQGIIEQSRALLEQSKRKHQAMIAQAHAAQQQGKMNPADSNFSNAGGFGSLGLGELANKQTSVLPPRPPQKPAGEKKPASQHRLARTTTVDDGGGGQFYNSLKYDSNTGAARSTIYNNGS